MSVNYEKPWLSFRGQTLQLRSYGLTIADESKAEIFLQHINYYRFCGYGLVFEQQRHKYIEGTTFEQIRKVYEFDRTLRDLLGEALEIIELDFRTLVAYNFGKAFKAFGHTDPNNFYKWHGHREWLETIQTRTRESSDPFIKHFRENYNEFPNLPIWVLTEIMSFGSISRMYSQMYKNDQKTICSRYGLQPEDLKSWIHHLVYIRNICAHHSRIWDREYKVVSARLPSNVWKVTSVPRNDKLFASLVVISHLLNRCTSEKHFTADWKKRVMHHLKTNRPVIPGTPDALIKHAGFANDWETHPLWV